MTAKTFWMNFQSNSLQDKLSRKESLWVAFLSGALSTLAVQDRKAKRRKSIINHFLMAKSLSVLSGYSQLRISNKFRKCLNPENRLQFSSLIGHLGQIPLAPRSRWNRIHTSKDFSSQCEMFKREPPLVGSGAKFLLFRAQTFPLYLYPNVF